jgi:hypothetical protein
LNTAIQRGLAYPVTVLTIGRYTKRSQGREGGIDVGVKGHGQLNTSANQTVPVTRATSLEVPEILAESRGAIVDIIAIPIKAHQSVNIKIQELQG